MAMNLIFLLSNAFDESSSSSFGGGCAMVELSKNALLWVALRPTGFYVVRSGTERNRKEASTQT